MPLRLLTGGQVAASAWLMPDDSVVFVKLTQREFETARDADTLPLLRKPDPNARFVMAIGGMPALDTVDGYPGPGDYWEGPGVDLNDNPATVLHYQTGTDLFGVWQHTMARQKLDAQRKQAIDPVTGKPLLEYTQQITGVHRDVLVAYDLKTIGQYVPRPATRTVDMTPTPFVLGVSALAPPTLGTGNVL